MTATRRQIHEAMGKYPMGRYTAYVDGVEVEIRVVGYDLLSCGNVGLVYWKPRGGFFHVICPHCHPRIRLELVQEIE